MFMYLSLFGLFVSIAAKATPEHISYGSVLPIGKGLGGGIHGNQLIHGRGVGHGLLGAGFGGAGHLGLGQGVGFGSGIGGIGGFGGSLGHSGGYGLGHNAGYGTNAVSYGHTTGYNSGFGHSYGTQYRHGGHQSNHKLGYSKKKGIEYGKDYVGIVSPGYGNGYHGRTHLDKGNIYTGGHGLGGIGHHGNIRYNTYSNYH